MKLENIKTKLSAAGLEVEERTLYNAGGSGIDLPCLLVNHNFEGLYMSGDAARKAAAAAKIAIKYGFKFETRGGKTATIIY